MTERAAHPTISDVALALATRQRSESGSKVTLERPRTGDIVIGLEHSGPDLEKATAAATATFDVLLAKYPRENGGQ